MNYIELQRTQSARL